MKNLEQYLSYLFKLKKETLSRSSKGEASKERILLSPDHHILDDLYIQEYFVNGTKDSIDKIADPDIKQYLTTLESFKKSYQNIEPLSEDDHLLEHFTNLSDNIKKVLAYDLDKKEQHSQTMLSLYEPLFKRMLDEKKAGSLILHQTKEFDSNEKLSGSYLTGIRIPEEIPFTDIIVDRNRLHFDLDSCSLKRQLIYILYLCSNPTKGYLDLIYSTIRELSIGICDLEKRSNLIKQIKFLHEEEYKDTWFPSFEEYKLYLKDVLEIFTISGQYKVRIYSGEDSDNISIIHKNPQFNVLYDDYFLPEIIGEYYSELTTEPGALFIGYELERELYNDRSRSFNDSLFEGFYLCLAFIDLGFAGKEYVKGLEDFKRWLERLEDGKIKDLYLRFYFEILQDLEHYRRESDARILYLKHFLTITNSKVRDRISKEVFDDIYQGLNNSEVDIDELFKNVFTLIVFSNRSYFYKLTGKDSFNLKVGANHLPFSIIEELEEAVFTDNLEERQVKVLSLLEKYNGKNLPKLFPTLLETDYELNQGIIFKLIINYLNILYKGRIDFNEIIEEDYLL